MTEIRKSLTDDEFIRIDEACKAVIADPADFTEFEVDFASDYANRLSQYGRRTFVSPKQWNVIRNIERKIDGDHR